MSVIEFAEKRLDEESRIPDSRDVQYWAAYLDGARAQQREQEKEAAAK